MASIDKTLKELKIQRVQPKGGINIFTSESALTSSRSSSLEEGSNFMSKIFDEGSYSDPSFSRRINTVFQYTDAYQDALYDLTNGGTSAVTAPLKDQAIRNAQANLTAKQGNFAIPLTDFEEVIENNSFFNESRGFWNEVKGNVSLFDAPATNPVDRKRQNIFVKNVAEQLSNSLSVGDIQAEYGNREVRRYRPPQASIVGEMSGYNIESKEVFANKFMNDIFGDSGRKNHSSIMQNFDSYFDGIGGTLDDTTRNELKHKISQDLNPSGYVGIHVLTANLQEETKERLVDIAYRAAQGDDANLVSVMPGKVLHGALSDGTTQDHRFANNLSSNNSKFFKQVIKNSERQAIEQTSSSSIRDIFNAQSLSQEVTSQLKTTKSVQSKMDNYVYQTQETYGFSNKNKTSVVQKTNHEKRVTEALLGFEREGYKTTLDYSKDNKNLYLTFADASSSVDLSGMTLSEKLASENVGRILMPLEGDDFLTNIQGNHVQSRLFLESKSKDGFDMVNTHRNQPVIRRMSDKAYDEIDKIPGFMRRQQERNPSMSEAVIYNRGAANYQNKMMRIAQPVRFPGEKGSEGFKVGSVSKNLAGSSIMDIGDYTEDYYKQAFPDSYKKFDEYRIGLGEPNLRYVDAIGFRDNAWVNPQTGKREPMNMAVHMMAESRARFNEQFGMDKLGLHGTTYGLNANQMFSGHIGIGDWRRQIPLGELNSATREQILKVPNYAAMDRDVIGSYLTEQLGDEVGARYMAPITRVGMEGINETEAMRNEIAEVYARTIHTNDKEISDNLGAVTSRIQKELDITNSELGVTTDASKKIELQIRKEKLEGSLDIAKSNRLSVFEEQMLVRESFMESLQTSQQVNKALDDGYELPEALRNRLAADNKGMVDSSGNLIPGTYATNIGYDDLREMGLSDHRARVTVGTLTKEYAEERGVSMSPEIANQSQLFYKGSRISGIEIDKAGNTSLVIDQLMQGQDGSKFIEGFGGTRTTGTVVPDLLYDYLQEEMLGYKPKHATNIMREHIKHGRNPQGQLINTLVNTSYFNAMEDLDEVLVMGADGAYRIDASKATSSAVKEWAEKNKNQYGTKEGYQRDFLENRFIKDIDNVGYEGMVQLSEEGSRGALIQIANTSDINFRMADGIDPVLGRKQLYDKLYDTATERYDYNSRYAIGANRLHDVHNWHGEGGASYADRESKMLGIITNRYLGSDSDLSQQLRNMGQSDWAEQHRGFAKQVHRNLEVLTDAGQDLRQYEGGNNVIFDFSGKFEGDSNVVRRTAADGSQYYVVDGSSIPRADKTIGMMKGSDALRTTEDLMSMQLTGFDDIAETYTVQNLIRDEHSQAVIKLPDGYSKKVAPVFPYFGEDYDQQSTLYQREFNKGQSQLLNSLDNIAALGPDGNPAAIQRFTNRAEAGLQQMSSGGHSYLTGKGNSDFMKSQFQMDTRRGFSGILGGYNTESDFLRDGEFGVSSEMARHMMSGNEDNILAANNITNMRGKSAEEKQDFILKQITGQSTDDSEFNFIASYNRFPTQSQGSIQFGSVRVDEGLEGTSRLMIGRYVADASGADFDGDVGYLQASHYTDYTEGNTNFFRLQKDLITMSSISKESIAAIEQEGLTEGLTAKQISERIQAINGVEMPEETFSYLRRLDENSQTDLQKLREVFGTFEGSTAEVLDIAAKSTQVPGIGYMDNELVSGRNLIVSTFDDLVKEGVIGHDEMNSWISRYDQGSDMLVQGYISAKKLDDNMLNVMDSAGEVLESFADMDESRKLQRLQEITGERLVLPGSLSAINTSNFDETIEQFIQTSAIGREDAGKIKDYMLPLAYANEVQTFRGASRNDSLKLIRSMGTDALELTDKIQNNPGSLYNTPEMLSYITGIYGQDSPEMAGFVSAQSESSARVAENWKNLISREGELTGGTSSSEISDSIIQNLDFTRSLSEKSNIDRKVVSRNETFNQLKRFASTTANSNAFKVGAGAAAMWMLSSSLRSGPTPEGNDAQQEATAAEVNPTALLTSPTARVTPNTENVSLKISGSGNLNEAAMAGLVNNEINAMMGAQMNMNVNITDNTRRLDRSFYEQQINSVLGL